MSNKRRIVVTVHHRDELSLGENRLRLGHSAFHWGILVMPKTSRGKDCSAYDVSDGSGMDADTGQMRNTALDWEFRPKRLIDPLRSGRLLGRIIIGKIPNDVPVSAIEALLKDIPLPDKNANPRQSCVTWTLDAILALQGAGLARNFDLGPFHTWALEFADRSLANPSPNTIKEYKP